MTNDELRFKVTALEQQAAELRRELALGSKVDVFFGAPYEPEHGDFVVLNGDPLRVGISPNGKIVELHGIDDGWQYEREKLPPVEPLYTRAQVEAIVRRALENK